MASSPVPTGNETLDMILGGGLEPGVITQFFGEPASGKSTICVMVAVEVLKSGRGVAFLDTEGFSVERFRQIAGADAEKLAENLFLFEPADFDQQGVMIGSIDGLFRSHDIGVVIVDSATGLYRTQLEKGREAMQKLTRQMLQLLGYAKRFRIPVVISNQVYMDIRRDQYFGLGGTALEHISKVIVRTERQNSHRKAILVKHRSRPAGGSFEFDIVETGISARE